MPTALVLASAAIAQADAPLLAGCSILVGDEFWKFVRGVLGEYANELARQLLELGLALIIATQQLSDLDNSEGLGRHLRLRQLPAAGRRRALVPTARAA